MKKGGFVEAVTYGVEHNTIWEGAYYYNCERRNWDARKLNVYMETRNSALGPEWSDLRRVVMQMKGLIPRARIDGRLTQ